jgi:low affinity Fe/Cu permease
MFLLQYTQEKDTQAIQKKLDELIKSIDNADDRLIGIEKKIEDE